jgi:hypothetical protein
VFRHYELGEAPQFVHGIPPRPADAGQIRALHSGTLSPELADEVEDLIALFREWHDAERRELIELAKKTGTDPFEDLGREPTQDFGSGSTQ